MLFFALLTIHVFLMDCIWNDIGALRAQGREPWPCGRFGWVFITLGFGLLAVIAYWLTNRSTLRVHERTVRAVPGSREQLRD